MLVPDADAPDIPILDTPCAIRAWSDERHQAGRTVALVPTMGALHAGHAALVDTARRGGHDVVVSIFVNPLQFNRPDDLAAYPRPLDDDLRICSELGVDAVYLPTAESMYPAGFQTHVDPGSLAEPLEGLHRPGHFRGVATVVCKLFGAVRPDLAMFGQKDHQQLAIVRRMVTDLDMSVTVVSIPTVREHDGLAMSSRNRRLGDEDRAAARCVPACLQAMKTANTAGVRDARELEQVGSTVIATEPRARLEYLSVVDPDTLLAVDDVTGGALALVAVWFGEVRLIDNEILGA